jgi:hypothetical protein
LCGVIHPSLPEKHTRERGLSASTLVSGQHAGQQRGATQRLGGGELSSVDPGGRLPDPRTQRLRLISSGVGLSGGLVEGVFSSDCAATLEQQPSKQHERLRRGRQRVSSHQRSRHIAQQPLGGRVTTTARELGCTRCPRDVSKDVV